MVKGGISMTVYFGYDSIARVDKEHGFHFVITANN
jgi:hypothetical protein